MYYKGIYHLFYQYNPKGAVWGNIVWAHSISRNLIDWVPLEPAIFPSVPSDINGCWSGSATILPGNRPAILYTGIDPQQRQVQNIAYPANLSDPYLREWVKPENNPIVVPDSSVNASAFRDPTTAWWENGHWRILVGGKHNKRGMAHLYRSRDFITWTKAKHPLHSARDTGMWECPDFFPVSLYNEKGLDTSVVGKNVRHVLKVSLDLTRYEYYTVGTYYPDIDRYIPSNNSADGWGGLRYDYGNFYASKTFFDEENQRRILWGWANESDTPDNDTAKGWAGIQAIPRTLWLDKGKKQLVQWPIREIDTLRGQKFEVKNHELKMGENVEIPEISAAQVFFSPSSLFVAVENFNSFISRASSYLENKLQADVEVTFSLPSLEKAEKFDPSWINAQDLCGIKGSTVQGGVGPFGLLTLASQNLEEYTPVFFRVFKAEDKHVVLMCSDAKP